MTTTIMGTEIKELVICKHYFHYDGIKYIEFQTVDDADKIYWIRMSEIDLAVHRSENNAFLIKGEIEKLIPMKTMLGADQHFETVLKNCVILETKNMSTYEMLEDMEKYPDSIIPCEDKTRSFFKEEYQIGRMVTTTFQFEKEKGMFKESILLKETAKGSEREYFFILDEDDEYYRLLNAKKDHYIYFIEKEKMALFFEPMNVTTLRTIEKLTFKSIGINSTILVSGDVSNTHFYHVYLYESLKNITTDPYTYYQSGIVADFDKQLYKQGKKKNEMEFELYFFDQKFDMNKINHLLFWDNNKYIGYTKEGGKFILDNDKTHFENRNGFTRKKYLGDESKPHHLENIQYSKLY